MKFLEKFLSSNVTTFLLVKMWYGTLCIADATEVK